MWTASIYSDCSFCKLIDRLVCLKFNTVINFKNLSNRNKSSDKKTKKCHTTRNTRLGKKNSSSHHWQASFLEVQIRSWVTPSIQSRQRCSRRVSTWAWNKATLRQSRTSCSKRDQLASIVESFLLSSAQLCTGQPSSASLSFSTLSGRTTKDCAKRFQVCSVLNIEHSSQACFQASVAHSSRHRLNTRRSRAKPGKSGRCARFTKAGQSQRLAQPASWRATSLM